MAFVDRGEFEAMKTLSGWEAARCDEHPFCAKIKVSTSLVPRPLPPPEERPGTHCLRMCDIFRYIFHKKLRALILSVCGRLY